MTKEQAIVEALSKVIMSSAYDKLYLAYDDNDVSDYEGLWKACCDYIKELEKLRELLAP